MLNPQGNTAWTSTVQRLHQLAIIAVVLVFLVAGSSLLAVFLHQKSVRNRMIENEIPAMMHSIHSDIMERIRSAQRIAESMASNQPLLDWESSAQPDANMQPWLQYVHRLKQKSGEESFFWASARRGRYYNEDGFLKSIDPENPRNAWLNELLSSQQDCHLNTASKELGIGHMLYVACRFDLGQKRQGAAGIGLDALKLTEYVNRFRISPSSHVFLVDDVGKFIAHRDIVLVEKEIPFDQVASLHALTDKLLRKQDFNISSHDGERGRTLLASTWIPELGIFAMAEIAEEEINSPIKTSVFTFAVANIAIGAVLLLLLIRTMRRASSSIRDVENISENIATKLDAERALSLTAFSSMTDGVVATDLDGRITYINKAACHQLGCNCAKKSPGLMYGKFLHEIYHPSSLSDFPLN